MADIKVSQLPHASGANPSDVFLTIQNGTSRQLTLSTLLGNLDSVQNIRVNPGRNAINFYVASKNHDSMLVVDGVNSFVGIKKQNPTEVLHVGGNIAIDGIIKSVPEALNAQSPAANAIISPLTEITSITPFGSSTYSLAAGSNGQAKYIYSPGKNGVGDAKIEISVPDGVGFDTIEISEPVDGKGIVLLYVYNKWVCVGNNGAVLS